MPTKTGGFAAARSARNGGGGSGANGKTGSARTSNRSSSPGPNRSVSPGPNPPKNGASGVPSWLALWSKPTVSSALLADGPQIKDFVAKPVPASSSPKRRSGALAVSATTDAAAAVGWGNTRAALVRANSISRCHANASHLSMSYDRAPSLDRASYDLNPQSVGSSAPGASVVAHFARVNSTSLGPGLAASPPLSRAALAAARFRSPNYSGAGGGGAAAADGQYGSPSWAWAPTTPGGGGGGSSGYVSQSSSYSGAAAAAAAPRRPLSAGPRPRCSGLLADPTTPSAAYFGTRCPNPVSSSGGSGTTVSGSGAMLSRSISNRNVTFMPQPHSGTSPGAGGPTRPARPVSASASFSSRGILRQSSSSMPTAAAAPAAAATRTTTLHAAGAFSGNNSGMGMGMSSWEAAHQHQQQQQRPRGPPSAPLRLGGLGPNEEQDQACVAVDTDLLLANPRADGAEGGAEPQPQQPAAGYHIPLPQHMLLSGDLQEMYERVLRSGERSLHLSLAGVTFHGDLDPNLLSTLRVMNRTVILHNCTLALKPGQKLWVGPGGHVILADVTIVTATAKTLAAGKVAAAAAAEGGSGGGPVPPLRRTTSMSRLGGGGGGGASQGHQGHYAMHHHGYHGGSSGGGGDGTSSIVPSSFGAPMLHVVGGGRLLLRGCRVKVYPAEEPAGHEEHRRGVHVHKHHMQQHHRQGRPPAGSSSSSNGMAPRTPLAVSRNHPLTPHHNRGGGGSGSHLNHHNNHHQHHNHHHNHPTSSEVLCILAEGGGTAEAIGCRLGRCIVSDADSSLTLRRCRVKPGRACAPNAPLIMANDGAVLQAFQSEVKEGPASGIFAQGETTRVSLVQCAITDCHRNGISLLSGVAFAASTCRMSSNGAVGISARGESTAVELTDCELTRNMANNIAISEGVTLAMLSCSSLTCIEGSGLSVEGSTTRALAEVCNFDSNEECGVHVRGGSALELQDCSASNNAIHGVELEGLFDKSDSAEESAEATLASMPPPTAPLPEVFCLVAGGQLANNGSHGCAISCGAGLRVSGCELSQNARDGAYADGLGCELVLDGCRVLENKESGVFVCSGAAVWGESCRLGGSLHGDVSVGGKGSRGRLVGCVFEYNPQLALRVHMGAKVALRECVMEPQPEANIFDILDPNGPKIRIPTVNPQTAQPPQPQQQPPPKAKLLDVEELRKREAEKGWAVHGVRSQCVQVLGKGTILSVDGRAFFGSADGEEPEGQRSGS